MDRGVNRVHVLHTRSPFLRDKLVTHGMCFRLPWLGPQCPSLSGFAGGQLQYPIVGVYLGRVAAPRGDNVNTQAGQPHDEGAERDPCGTSRDATALRQGPPSP